MVVSVRHLPFWLKTADLGGKKRLLPLKLIIFQEPAITSRFENLFLNTQKFRKYQESFTVHVNQQTSNSTLTLYCARMWIEKFRFMIWTELPSFQTFEEKWRDSLNSKEHTMSFIVCSIQFSNQKVDRVHRIFSFISYSVLHRFIVCAFIEL